MTLLLKAIAAALVIQLLFACWNTVHLPLLGSGGSAPGRRAGRERSREAGAEANERTEPEDGAEEAGGTMHKTAVNPKPGSFPRKSCGEASGARPVLSILIPARDEADRIGGCLASVLACREAEAAEILVLDDGSEDGTAEAARRAGGPAVTVLAGRPLPEGWAGKPHACAQLAEAARGKWLLFLDADVRLAPDALAAALATGEAAVGGLVTGFPRQETGTWLERLVVPLMLFTVVCHLPVPLVRGSADPRFVAAHGGFMLIRRDAYDACGGHRAVASALVDDMALARAVKSAGMPVTLANLSDHVRMRMYENAGEVWRGYRKNLYDGLGRRPLLLLGVMAVYLTGYVLPPAVLLGAGFAGDPGPAAWACACMLLGAAIKRVADAAGRKSGGYALLLPAGMLALAFIAAASWRGAGRGYWWKGRRYL